MSVPEFELLGRDGCGLCHEMAVALRAALDAHPAAVSLVERDVDADPELVRRFGRHVPVLRLAGAVLCAHRLDPARVASALGGQPWEPLELG